MATPATVDAAPAETRQLRVLTALLQIERRARAAATVEELGFLAVNETLGLVRYRQAVLWSRDGRIAALSGVPLVDRNAPYVLWLTRALAWAQAAHGGGGAVPLAAADLPPELARDWADWLPPHGLWLPLGESGALLLAREEPWGAAEAHVLGYVADAYGHAWSALERRRGGWRLPKKRGRAVLMAAALALAVGALAFPMPQSALAPAEVIARAPTLVRAPIDGVVDRFEVTPNQAVAEGQVLLVLDRTRLQNRLEVARKALEVAEAEHRQASQQALFDPRSKANLAMLKGRIDQQAAEVTYVKELLSRVEIRAPRAGIAIFDDVNDWIGKPVTIGERILTVADPQETELEIRLPVADAIALATGSDVRLFLNVDPQRPIPAKLSFAGYQADTTPEGVLAYRLKAEFDPGAPQPRIGLKGIAKLYGQDSTLGLALLHRPLAALRQRLGV
ncbi:efflux RND transporter periplasmic adaptor subunit [Azospirillum sp. sgz301742]